MGLRPRHPIQAIPNVWESSFEPFPENGYYPVSPFSAVEAVALLWFTAVVVELKIRAAS
jgi:hypothetical protein